MDKIALGTAVSAIVITLVCALYGCSSVPQAQRCDNLRRALEAQKLVLPALEAHCANSGKDCTQILSAAKGMVLAGELVLAEECPSWD